MGFYSFSKLEAYNRCSYFFWQYYIDKTLPRPDTDNISTVIGNICHDVLEEYYLQFVNKLPVIESVPVLMERFWAKRLADDGLTELLAHLQYYDQQVAWLYHKSSADYQGADAIRSGKGRDRKVPTMPERTTDWKNAWTAAGLDPLSAQIDQYSRRVAQEREDARAALVLANPDEKVEKLKSRFWLKMPVQEVYATSWNILRNYKDPLLGTDIKAVEFKITDYDQDFKHIVSPVELRPAYQKVLYPALGDKSPVIDVPVTYLTGFIDLVAIDAHGRTYIIDHKTSKGDAPTPYKVQHWEQLLLYGWAWKQLTGSYPNFIGLNWLRKGELVCAPFDPILAEGAVQRKLAAIRSVEAEIFLQHSPADYGSPCMGYGEEPCGYLQFCHPSFYTALMNDPTRKGAAVAAG